MKSFFMGQVEVVASEYVREGEYIFISNNKGKNKMSFIKRKEEIEKKIEDLIESYRQELAKIDDKLDFFTEDEKEIKARLYKSVSGLALQIRGSIVLYGEDLLKFIEYMDHVKAEYMDYNK